MSDFLNSHVHPVYIGYFVLSPGGNYATFGVDDKLDSEHTIKVSYKDNSYIYYYAGNATYTQVKSPTKLVLKYEDIEEDWRGEKIWCGRKHTYEANKEYNLASVEFTPSPENTDEIGIQGGDLPTWDEYLNELSKNAYYGGIYKIGLRTDIVTTELKGLYSTKDGTYDISFSPNDITEYDNTVMYVYLSIDKSTGKATTHTKKDYDDAKRIHDEQSGYDNAVDTYKDAAAAAEDIRKTFSERASDMDAYKLSLNSKMIDFKNMMDKVEKKFNHSRTVYTMYFRFKLNNEVLIDTCGYADGSNNALITNCLVSFTYDKNGTGSANQFTIDIIFKQNDRSIMDIHTLEKKLLDACDIYKVDNNAELKNLDEIFCNCSFQYGYGDDPSMRSEEYRGKIMQYNCNIDNGNLRYTLKGVGSIYCAKEIRLSTKPEYLERDGRSLDVSEIRPLEYIQRIFEVEFETEGSENYKLFELKFAESCYDAEFPTKLIGENQNADFTQFQQKNIFQIIEDILAGTITTAQYNLMSGVNNDGSSSGTRKTISPNQKEVFGFFLDDSQKTSPNSLGTIIIYVTPNLQNGRTETSVGASVNMNFNWFGPSDFKGEGHDGDSNYNHLVLSWKPEYDGEILMGMAASLGINGNTYQTIDYIGNIIDVKSMGATRLGALDAGELIFSTIQEYSKWSSKTQYSYKAKLTMIGCPCEIPMTGLIRINAIMGRMNNIHHSSGLYFVTKIRDIINSSGFITELELFKLKKGYDPRYEVMDEYMSNLFSLATLTSVEIAEYKAQATMYRELFDLLYVKYMNASQNPRELTENTKLVLPETATEEDKQLYMEMENFIYSNIFYNADSLKHKREETNRSVWSNDVAKAEAYLTELYENKQQEGGN